MKPAVKSLSKGYSLSQRVLDLVYNASDKEEVLENLTELRKILVETKKVGLEDILLTAKGVQPSTLAINDGYDMLRLMDNIRIVGISTVDDLKARLESPEGSELKDNIEASVELLKLVSSQLLQSARKGIHLENDHPLEVGFEP